MKNVLVIAYHYPPEEGSCSDKNIKIVKTLINSGYSVSVLTKNKGFKEKKVDDAKIIRLKNGYMHKDWKDGQSPFTISNNEGLSRISRFKKVISSYIIPDATIDWSYEVKRWVKKNKNTIKNQDIIFSISSPYSAHIISYNIAKKFNIPLILCYGDPWIYEPKRKRGFIRYRIEKLLEGNILNYASKILLITEWNKNKYSEIYKINSEKISTYNIGYDPQKIRKQNKKSNNCSKLKLIYGGSLDEVHRNPEPFLKALTEINDVVTNIYNEDNLRVREIVESYQLGNKVKVNNLISTYEFENRLYDMDVLLLFGNKTPFQVPGKLFTYIATGMHILYIKNNNYETDGTQEILKEYKNATIVTNDVKSILMGLRGIMNIFKEDRLGEECSQGKYEYRETMAPIVEAIKNTKKN